MTTILHRRGTSAQWLAVNPILSSSEIGFETDTGHFKIGNGYSRWADLSYITGAPPPANVSMSLDQLTDVVAPETTPKDNLLGTTEVGVWSPVPISDLKTLFNEQIVSEIGDPLFLVSLHHANDLVHWLMWLEGRVNALEQAASEPGANPIPQIEGSLEVDNYANGFIRVRDTGNILADGEVHAVNMVLATQAGPGGAVIDPNTGIPASSNPVWFDRNGTLGYVKGATNSNVSQTTLRNWVKYSNPASSNYYMEWVHLTSDPADNKPVLIVDRVANVV